MKRLGRLCQLEPHQFTVSGPMISRSVSKILQRRR